MIFKNKFFLIFKSKSDYLKSKIPDIIITPTIKKKIKNKVSCIYCGKKIGKNYYSRHIPRCKVYNHSIIQH